MWFVPRTQNLLYVQEIVDNKRLLELDGGEFKQGRDCKRSYNNVADMESSQQNDRSQPKESSRDPFSKALAQV